jgi:F0F1-type ATP synthase alpha subunit
MEKHGQDGWDNRADTDTPCSDGIARVYGMSNVQAEELVE